MIDLNHLKSFIKIAEDKTLRKAALNLNISQSALSNQIKLLETRLGLPLFDRTSKGMALSDNGRILYSHANEILINVESLSSKAKELAGNSKRTIKIGLNTDGRFLKVGKLTMSLAAHFPNVDFVFISVQTENTFEMLRNEQIDIGFFFGENRENNIKHEVIDYSPVQIVIPRKFIPKDFTPHWKRITPLPWIWTMCKCPYYAIVQNKMDELGLVPNKMITAMDETVVRELLIDGQGVGVLREDDARYVESMGNVYIWEEENFSIPLCLGLLLKNQHNKLHTTVVELVLQIWKGKSLSNTHPTD